MSARRQRQLTIAAQKIALRNSLMSSSLRKSEPRLLNLYNDKLKNDPAASKETDNDEVKLESHLVNLSVSATDRDGKAISGLGKDDFSVYEDDVKQQITQFSPEHTPFNLVILLDMSGSVESKRGLIKDAALHFIDVINPKDKVAVITFTTDVIAVSHLTDSREDTRDNISNLVFPTGGTSFYDSLGYVLVEELRKVKGQRNAVVVLTDGEDNSIMSNLTRDFNTINHRNGSFLTFAELLEGVKEADALIYPIHVEVGANFRKSNAIMAPPSTGKGNNNGARLSQPNPIPAEASAIAKKQLQQLADVSGGRTLRCRTRRGFERGL